MSELFEFLQVHAVFIATLTCVRNSSRMTQGGELLREERCEASLLFMCAAEAYRSCMSMKLVVHVC